MHQYPLSQKGYWTILGEHRHALYAALMMLETQIVERAEYKDVCKKIIEGTTFPLPYMTKKSQNKVLFPLFSLRDVPDWLVSRIRRYSSECRRQDQQPERTSMASIRCSERLGFAWNSCQIYQLIEELTTMRTIQVTASLAIRPNRRLTNGRSSRLTFPLTSQVTRNIRLCRGMSLNSRRN